MKINNKPDIQDDNRRTRFRLTKIMSAIILAALQILLLLLRAHFNRNDDQNKAIQEIREAQAKLAEIAEAFEVKIRYASPSIGNIDRIQDLMDKERNKN